MADMYGAVRSNWFRVNDKAAFREWFDTYCYFGDEIELWEGEGDTMAFGGYEQYPSAYPRIRKQDDAGEASGDIDDWDLVEFAGRLRQHLMEGETFLVVAGGNEKLRYVAATRLQVSQRDDVEPTFEQWYAGN